MKYLTRREILAGLIAVALVATLAMSGERAQVHAAVTEPFPECQTYAVRIHEDNGWGMKKIHPPRFYCDPGHRLEPFRDGLLVCVCEAEPLPKCAEIAEGSEWPSRPGSVVERVEGKTVVVTAVVDNAEGQEEVTFPCR